MPLSAKLSILHRLTGLALSLGAVIMVSWLFSLAYRPDVAVSLHAMFLSSIGQVVLIAWTFAFFYHFCNGIRHLFWDVGKGFEIDAVNRSGVIAVIAALVLTAITWVVGV